MSPRSSSARVPVELPSARAARGDLALVRAALEEQLALSRRLLEQSVGSIVDAGRRVRAALASGRKILLFGNGGSAADSQHIAAEFIGRFQKARAALPALALTVNTSALTAIANDFGYEEVFARQVEGLGAAGDVAIGISTSGRSRNVVAGLKRARARGLVTIALTGAQGGAVGAEADLTLAVPSENTQRIQEAHIAIGHILCELAEQAGDPGPATGRGFPGGIRSQDRPAR